MYVHFDPLANMSEVNVLLMLVTIATVVSLENINSFFQTA